MITVRTTAALTGVALEWAVDKGEGYVRPDGGYYVGHHGHHIRWTTDGKRGMEILEREGMALTPKGRYDKGIFIVESWSAAIPFTTHSVEGPTALIAICRCYVLSKLGATVEVPSRFF